MKRIYLILSLIGFVLPNIFVMQVSIDSGNILLYTNPLATIAGMFANRISTIFMIDLLFAVLVFFLWTYYENKKQKIKGLPLVWAATMLFGLAGAFPLFLYLKETHQKTPTLLGTLVSFLCFPFLRPLWEGAVFVKGKNDRGNGGKG